MATTLEALEQRVAALERAVARLQPPPPPSDETPQQRLQRSLRENTVDQAAMNAAWDRLFEKLGITDLKPIGAEQLQAMQLAEGLDPNDNAASRGIIEMREE
jgi:hypothetical protein